MVSMIQTCLLATCALLPLQAVQLSAVTPRLRPVGYVEKPRDLEPDVNLTDEEASIVNEHGSNGGLNHGPPAPETKVPPPKTGPLAHGLVVIKTPKAAGSTLGGALRRLAFKNGVRGAHETNPNPMESNIPMPMIAAYQEHRDIMEKRLHPKLSKAFYVSNVREPAERELSAYYYIEKCTHTGKHQGESLLEYFERVEDDVQAKFMQTKDNMSAQEIIKLYDFVTVAERFDESLVILARKLKVSKNDVLYMSSKRSGSHSSGCPAYPPLKDQDAKIRKAAKKFSLGRDAELVKLANEALDRAIDNYDGFQKDLKEFKQQLAVIKEECAEHAFKECMWGGAGCGQLCIEKVINEKNW